MVGSIDTVPVGVPLAHFEFLSSSLLLGDFNVPSDYLFSHLSK